MAPAHRRAASLRLLHIDERAQALLHVQIEIRLGVEQLPASRAVQLAAALPAQMERQVLALAERARAIRARDACGRLRSARRLRSPGDRCCSRRRRHRRCARAGPLLATVRLTRQLQLVLVACSCRRPRMAYVRWFWMAMYDQTLDRRCRRKDHRFVQGVQFSLL